MKAQAESPPKTTYSDKAVAEAPAKKSNPSEALAEARTPNGLSASGSPYPDGG